MAADRREFQGFARAGWALKRCRIGLRWSASTVVGGCRTLLVAHGPGRHNAGQAVRLAAERFDLGAVVSTGYAGALNPGLRIGDILIAYRVVQFEGRLEYAVRLPVCVPSASVTQGILLTLDQVAQDTGVKVRLRATGADAVDMEASGVAAEAGRRQLPLYCVRSISDEAHTAFEIDFNRARRKDGTFSGWRVLAQAGFRPSRWRHLMKLRRDGIKASLRLGQCLQQCRFDF